MYSTDLNNLDDLQLIARYKQSKDNNFVGILYQRYTHLIFGVCMKYLKNEQDAQDASILIFEKMLKDLLKYDVLEFKSWLYVLCKTYCLMQLRSGVSVQKKEKEMQNYMVHSMENEFEAHLSNGNQKEIQLTYMEDCMKQLNNDQQVCIELFYLHEKSYQEVCNETNFTLNNVKSYIQNGQRNLKNCIESRLK
jgi:RNA polymerase sigma-70 factor (ECF subfamily)